MGSTNFKTYKAGADRYFVEGTRIYKDNGDGSFKTDGSDKDTFLGDAKAYSIKSELEPGKLSEFLVLDFMNDGYTSADDKVW